MKSIKAVLAGSLFIVIVTLVIQLVMVFLAVGYHYLARQFPLLNEITVYFRYLVGYPVFFGVLFAGGYLTASIAQKRVLLHCLPVGLLTIGISTLSALDYMVLTFTGALMVLLALLAVMAGGWYWQRTKNRDRDDPPPIHIRTPTV